MPFDHFENSVTICELPPGSVVVVNSSLLHARRSLDGGEDWPRYFIDTSFCEIGGDWFPYLEKGNWKKMIKKLLEFDRTLNNGQYSFMFDENQFKLNFKSWFIHTLRLRRLVNKFKSIVSPKNGKIIKH
jgi:hypothetical protein